MLGCVYVCDWFGDTVRVCHYDCDWEQGDILVYVFLACFGPWMYVNDWFGNMFVTGLGLGHYVGLCLYLTSL